MIVIPPRCATDALPMHSFVDSLRVELAGRKPRCCTVADPAGQMLATSAVVVTIGIEPCDTDAKSIRVSAINPSGIRAERDVALADVVLATRARTLALAVAELLRSLEPEADDRQVAAANPAETTAVSLLPTTEPRRTRFAAVEADVRLFPTRDTWLWGGRAQLASGHRVLRATVDVGAAFSGTSSELGDVSLRTASLGLSIGPSVMAKAGVLDVGLRAELGWAWIRGEGRAAAVHSGAGSDMVSSLGVRVSLATPSGRRTRVSLAFESGGVLRGITGEVANRTVVGMTGYYLLAALGVGQAW